MTVLQSAIKAIIEKDTELLEGAIKFMAETIMEVEVDELVGAQRYERSEERGNYRNGYRDRKWDTRGGTISLKIPKLRSGSYFPSILEPRRRSEQALRAAILEAYVHGVSTRKVEDLVQAMGLERLDKNQVSRICSDLDELVEQFRSGEIAGKHPYLWLDATYLKVRQNGRVMNMAAVVAVAVYEDGRRRALGCDIGPAEDEAFWLQFLRNLVARGLSGVQLVISDAHSGLRSALKTVFSGAAAQRCRVHFMRNLLSYVPKPAQQMVAATVRTIFAQPDIHGARRQLRAVVDTLTPQFRRAADLLEEAGEDVLAYMTFPEEHRRQLHSTNTLERLNREIKRRTDVIGIFPNPASALRVIVALLDEQNDEWETGRRYFSEGSMRLLLATPESTPAAMLPMSSSLAPGGCS